MLKPIAAAVGAGLVVAGLAIAAPQKDTYKLNANLKARFEVPKAQGVPTGATGLFTGTVVELEDDRARLTWRLTYSNLSGRAAAAHIHAGKLGKAGGVLVALCGPCRTGQRGSASISHAQLRTIRAGAAYVNLHTAKNAAGEIRGQVKASEQSGSNPDPAPPSDPEPAPTPYPPYP